MTDEEKFIDWLSPDPEQERLRLLGEKAAKFIDGHFARAEGMGILYRCVANPHEDLIIVSRHDLGLFLVGFTDEIAPTVEATT